MLIRPGAEVNHAFWDSSSRKASALAAQGGERDLIIISATASDPEFVLNLHHSDRQVLALGA
jgi:superfamily I DNA and/or RNA helicase